jgi:hypothetical protein
VSVPEAENHAGGNDGCPYCCEGDEKDPYPIPIGRLRREVVDRDAVHGVQVGRPRSWETSGFL